MSSRAVAYLHQPRFRRPHGQLPSAPPSRRRRRCRHPPSRMKSWAVAGPLHPCGRATGVQLRLQPGPDPHRQPGGAVCGNDRGQRLHGRQSHRIRRRAPPARCTAVVHLVAHELTHVVQARPRPSCGPIVGDPDDASGRETDLVASSLVPGRARCRKSRLVAGLVAVLPLAGWSSRRRRRPATALTRALARS